ncbi:hypothetical protein CC80DRAFT_488898 [Byssothecium circinans]|uniref:Uncharacterized protein n=1 Tax=Byssothecium circinans TaxID=147558 RepID=A0A6A5U9D2_9PLEO|nr:hypothetical protein CC80DRAFT_488898 [Byssothecium circinans]
MPGLFTPNRSNTPMGSRPYLFEPAPRFALAGEPTGRQVTDSNPHETRKRNHADTTFEPPSTSFTFTSNSCADSLSYSRSTDVRSPPPLANERYELAGGMDRSAGRISRHYGDYDDYFNLEKQRGMCLSPASPYNGVQQQVQVEETQSTPNGSKPWVLNQLMSLVGGVAGKLVQFCAVPFRGFQAGGGQAYTFNANGDVAAKLFMDELPDPVQQPPPGHLQEEDYGVQSIESIDSERPRMAKRLRTGDSWVVVEQDGSADSRPTTPRLTERRIPGHTRSPSQIPRPISRTSATTPTRKRPSLIPVSRRTTFDRKSLQGAVLVNQSQGHARAYSRDSYGSPVMFENKTTKKSPLPAESQRLINKVRRENFEDDARMRRMSTQMSAMLREARQALGSKFEVDEYMDDGSDGEEQF